MPESATSFSVIPEYWEGSSFQNAYFYDRQSITRSNPIGEGVAVLEADTLHDSILKSHFNTWIGFPAGIQSQRGYWVEYLQQDGHVMLVHHSLTPDAVTKSDDILLLDILNDVWSMVDEAPARDFPQPPEGLLQTAADLVRKIFTIYSKRFEVYHTEDNEIEIDIPNLRGSSVVVVCDTQGRASVDVNIRGDYRSRQYASAQLLPDYFLCQALMELTK